MVELRVSAGPRPIYWVKLGWTTYLDADVVEAVATRQEPVCVEHHAGSNIAEL